MKGLFIKDFKLIGSQKQFIFLVLVTSLAMEFVSDDLSFMIGYLPFVASLLALSTIRYDEFDNGGAFLFTLPISRAAYAAQKYCLSLLLGGGTWLLAAALSMGLSAWRGSASVPEIALGAALILPALLAAQAVMLPFQLKYGGEKGRIALSGALGLLFVLGFALTRLARCFGIDLSGFLGRLSAAGTGALIAALTAAAALIFLLSLKISIRIVKNREF